LWLHLQFVNTVAWLSAAGLWSKLLSC